ncbi:putative DNA helicase [Reticulomyxa filosa]|uniref:Putative DNA helicase n=1 Tax=Reticulomyxa filosa TaxID=46433 RepID=X6N8G0_RETFI|nr:putative DNA helicase [Reticulomyxa filosa]|eukprot:ETO21592.1 putative DNA helicase [Reticulomyxa filosa]
MRLAKSLNYHVHWKRLLAIENEFEFSRIFSRNKPESVSDLQQEGLALFDLQLTWHGTYYGDVIYRMHMPGSQSLPYINTSYFGQGNVVLLQKWQKEEITNVTKQSLQQLIKEDVAISARAQIEQGRGELQEEDYRITLRDNDNNTKQKWRMDIGHDDTTYTTMDNALGLLYEPQNRDAPREKNRNTMIDSRDRMNPFLSTMIIDSFENPEKPWSFEKHSNEQNDSSFKVGIPSQYQSRYSKQGRESIEAELSRFFSDQKKIIMITIIIIIIIIITLTLQAIASTFENYCTLVQGPPGTGKTQTAVELIHLWRRTILNREYYSMQFCKFLDQSCKYNFGPILATAYTNSGVDQLLKGLMQKNLKVVRIGYPARLSSQLRSVCLEEYIQRHQYNEQLKALAKEEQKVNKALFHAKKKKKDMQTKLGEYENMVMTVPHMMNSNNECLEHLHTLRYVVITDIVHNADVLCSTCISLKRLLDHFRPLNTDSSGSKSSNFIKNLRFPLIVMDEASSLFEPAALVPIVQTTPDAHVVLIGDQKQLPPTVFSKEAKDLGLGVTLFDRFINRLDRLSWLLSPQLSQTLLSVQYRMHPDIAYWPNKIFYSEKVKNGDNVGLYSPVKIPGFTWPPRHDNKNDCARVLWCHVTNAEKRSISHSYCNELEATFIAQIIATLIRFTRDTPAESNPGTSDALKTSLIMLALFVHTKRNFTSSKVIIIIIRNVNNKKKAHLIRNMLKRIYGDSHEFININEITIDTVDAFQGQEKTLCILSCVRSNDKNVIGFLNDPRRINVALTRARKGLIIVGNYNTLSSHSRLWKDLTHFFLKNGRIVKVKEKRHGEDNFTTELFTPLTKTNNDLALPQLEHNNKLDNPTLWLMKFFLI